MSTNNPSQPTPNLRAGLEGHETSLLAVARLFSGSATTIEKVDEQWSLVSPQLDAVADDPLAARECVAALLRRLNGAARAESAEHQPIRATSRIESQDGLVRLAVGDAALGLEAAGVQQGPTGGTPVAPPGADYLAAASRVAALDQVLDIMGGPERLSTYDMAKVLEVISENVRPAVGQPGRQSRKPLVDVTNWISDDEWDSFRAVVHDPNVSGPDARHAAPPPWMQQPPNTLSWGLEDARGLVSRVVQHWRQTV